METQKHYIDANGNHFVATFNTEALAASYTPPNGAVAVSARPSTDHVWQSGAWVYVEPEVPMITPSDAPLTMRQLRLGLLYNGFPVTFIQDTIAAIADATERAVAQIWYEETAVVTWDHAMTQALIAAGGINQEDAATMWLAAKDIAA